MDIDFPRKVRQKTNEVDIDRFDIVSKPSVKVTDMPEDIVRRILKFIIGPSSPGTLDYQSLSQAKDAYALCSNHRYLFDIFRKYFHSAFLPCRMDDVKASALAKLFGPSLRHVNIFHRSTHDFEKKSFEVDSDLLLEPPSALCNISMPSEVTGILPDATCFFELLALQRPALHSLTLQVPASTPRIPNVEGPFSIEGIADICKSSANTLRALKLSIATMDYDLLTPKITPYLSNLRALCLQNSLLLRHEHLMLFLQASGSHLERLVLSHLSHPSLTRKSFRAMSSRCPKLLYLELHGFLAKSMRSFNSVAKSNPSFFRRLRGIRISKTRHQGKYWGYLTPIKENSEDLRHFDLYGVGFQVPPQVNDFIARTGHGLISLRLCQSLRSFPNNESSSAWVSHVRTLLPSLQEMHLEYVGRQAIEALIDRFAPQLKKLSIRWKASADDTLLQKISRCTSLTDLSLKFDIDPTVFKSLLRSSIYRITNVSVLTNMLMCIGSNLHRFSWWQPLAAINGSIDAPDDVHVANALREYCPKLEYASIYGIGTDACPENLYHHAFQVLLRQNPELTLYVNTQPPFWFGAERDM